MEHRQSAAVDTCCCMSSTAHSMHPSSAMQHLTCYKLQADVFNTSAGAASKKGNVWQPILIDRLLLMVLCTGVLLVLSLLSRKRYVPFLRRSGFPFLTVAMTMSPGPPAGRRFSLLPQPHTEMMYRFLAPVLSAQFMTAATGRPSDIANLLPEVPPLPLFDILATCEECLLEMPQGHKWQAIKLTYL